MKKNKLILSIVFFIIILFICYIYYSNNKIDTTFITIESNKIDKNIRIAHLSDLHGKRFDKKIHDIIDKEKPDLIVFTGDLIDSYDEIYYEKSVNLLEELANKYPLYYIRGNHEYKLDRYNYLMTLLNEIEGEFYFLNGRYENIIVNENDISIIGLDTSYSDLNLFINEKSYKIILHHYPEHFDDYNIYDVDLILSGHAHGGQFNFPFIGGVFAPGQGLNPDYYKGIHTKNNTNLIVSRGLGNSLFPSYLYIIQKLLL